MVLREAQEAYYNSKKISELRKRTTITKHQENTWIPIAQYNSRTGTYVNAAMNLQAITSYVTDNAYSYLAQEFSDDWRKLRKTGHWKYYNELRSYIQNSNIADSIVSYTFTYTVDYFQWQIVPFTYIDGYVKQPTLEELYDSVIPGSPTIPPEDRIEPSWDYPGGFPPTEEPTEVPWPIFPEQPTIPPGGFGQPNLYDPEVPTIQPDELEEPNLYEPGFPPTEEPTEVPWPVHPEQPTIPPGGFGQPNLGDPSLPTLPPGENVEPELNTPEIPTLDPDELEEPKLNDPQIPTLSPDEEEPKLNNPGFPPTVAPSEIPTNPQIPTLPPKDRVEPDLNDPVLPPSEEPTEEPTTPPRGFGQVVI